MPSRAPLRVWAAAALAFLAFLLMVLHREAGLRAARDRARAARIQAFAAVPGPRVIAIGSSALGADLLDEAGMGALSPGLAWLSLSMSNGTLEGFLPDLDGILAARPEVLLVDADLLYYRPTWSSPSAFPARAAEDFLVGLKERRAPRGPGPRLDLAHGPDQLQTYASYLEQREPRGLLPQGDPVLARLRQARARGIRIVLVEFPRYWQAEAGIPVRHREQAVRTRAQVERECGARVLAFPGRLPLDCYSDYSHLTGAGTAGYSAWLAGEVARLAGVP